jgi:hypothetical protein
MFLVSSDKKPPPDGSGRGISKKKIGAGDGFRTRDPKLGKLVLYQLSYARFLEGIITAGRYVVNPENSYVHDSSAGTFTGGGGLPLASG